MSLRNQPYFPFYVQDFANDEQLKECDAVAHGVYIRLMCLMHKSKNYGKILLEQKYQQLYQQNIQQNPQQDLNICSEFAGMFALKLVKHLPFPLLDIQNGVCQLLENGVIYRDGNFLCQKRMIKDGDISEKRASAGKKSSLGKGGVNNFVGTKFPTNNSTKFSTNGSTKSQQNTEYEIENKDSIDNMGGMGGKEEKEEDEIDYYIGNWTLKTKIKNCLYYFLNHEDFIDDRKACFELFKKQYVNFKDEVILDYIKIWGELFNESISGKYPERNMRGDDCWTQHFYNWLKNKNLREAPGGKEELNIEEKKVSFKKTLEPYLETYGKDVLNDFYRHWAEPDKTQKYLKWEMEKTWDVQMRLSTWYKKSVKFTK